ncbi:MAG: alpha/beta hydrolase [Candidatus Omnitrophota bacterium]
MKLVGILHKLENKTKLAVVISHGFTAKKERPRLIKLAEELSKSGIAALRFDFGGCGESQDKEITVQEQVDDLKSAINYLRKQGHINIGLLGESLGALTSILAYDDKIKAIVLWAPVTKAKSLSIIQDAELGQKLNREGFIIYKKEGKDFKIPKEYLIERQLVNQQEILSKIKCPILIFHGTKDDTIPLKDSQEAMQFLSKDSKLEIIEDVGHKLEEKMDMIIFTSVKWFKKYLMSA